MVGSGGCCRLWWLRNLLFVTAGYFALNVPSGLALYWFVNNLLSTGQQAWLKTTYADASSLPGASAISAADRAEEERQERVKQLTGDVLESTVCLDILYDAAPRFVEHSRHLQAFNDVLPTDAYAGQQKNARRSKIQIEQAGTTPQPTTACLSPCHLCPCSLKRSTNISSCNVGF